VLGDPVHCGCCIPFFFFLVGGGGWGGVGGGGGGVLPKLTVAWPLSRYLQPYFFQTKTQSLDIIYWVLQTPLGYMAQWPICLLSEQ
jgi:hypothetical protein